MNEQERKELALFQLQYFQFKNEVNGRLEKLEAGELALTEAFNDLLSRLDNYENRINVLEEARQRQIAFNSTVAVKGKEVKEGKEKRDTAKSKKSGLGN